MDSASTNLAASELSELLSKAVTYEENGDYSGAQHLYEQLVHRFETIAAVQRGLARVLMLQKKSFARAQHAVAQSIALEPQNADNFLLLGQLLESIGALDRAAKAYTAALERDPSNNAAKSALFRLSPKPQRKRSGGNSTPPMTFRGH